LYGYFGRKLDILETFNVKNVDLAYYVACKNIKNIHEINNEYSTIITSNNLNLDIMSELNNLFETDSGPSYRKIKANVAVAAAVTAYARIHMIDYKLLPGTVYTDTDSIFTTNILSDDLVGKELGLMKDELKGLTIKEAYFLGIKKYGYTYLDNNKLITKSVFAGVERDSLTFEEIIKLFKGKKITKQISIRFYKSFNNLNIKISNTHITIQKSYDKELVNNKYIPLSIPCEKKR
jgi:hypothetical protein